MERIPGIPSDSGSEAFGSSDASDKESTKKRSRRRSTSARFPSIDAKIVTGKEESSQPQSNALEALAHLATEARKTREKDEATTAEADDTSHDAGVDTSASYEELEDYGLGATEFSGGEVVIDLGGDSVEEHVLPLETEPEPVQEAEVVPTITSTEDLLATMLAESSNKPLPHEATPAEFDVPTPGTEPEAGFAEVNDAPVPTAEVPAYFAQPEDPYMQQHMAEQYAAAEVVPAAPQMNPLERPATKADVDDAIYHAAKAGQNRGVVTGLLAGAGYEHFKHKRREKRTEKRHAETVKKLDEARRNYAFNTEQHIKQQAEYVAQAAESSTQLAASERRLTALEQQRQIHPVAERQTPVANMTQQRVEQAPRPVVEQNAEQLVVAPEHRLQTSSWHSIEIDARTGRAVENPAFQYGHEYYREQAQENALGQPPAQDTTEQRVPKKTADTHDAPAGFGGDSLPPMYVPSSQSAPAAYQPIPSQQPASTRPVQPPVIPKASQTAMKPTQAAGPIWPLVVALLAVALCLIIAIR